MTSIAMSDPSFAAGGFAPYAWAFGQGVLVDFTPCVYPLIPITVAVFGAKGVSRPRALFLATAYVLGMAVLYTALGVGVAYSGGQFGQWLGDPRVVLPIAALLIALAASMFGAFDIQLPTSLQNRLNTVGGAGPVGAFLMGLVSGLISAPCTGPVLLSLLAYIAKSSAEGGSVLYGGSLLFVYALGMGTLFFAVALGASLFRPGPWMEKIKSVFGIALIVMAFWFMRPLSTGLADFIIDPTLGLWIGMGLVAVGLAMGAVGLSFHGSFKERARKGVAVTIAVVGAVVAVNNVLYVPPTIAWNKVTTLDEFEQSVQVAQEENKPIMIDFAATWCTPCLEMDKQTFHHETVEPVIARRFHLIKIDVSAPNDDQQRLQEALRSQTLPAVVFYRSGVDLDGQIATVRDGGEFSEADARINKLVGPEAFLSIIDPIR